MSTDHDPQSTIRRGTVTPHGKKWRVRFPLPNKKRLSAVYDTEELAETIRLGLQHLYSGRERVSLESYGEGWLDRRETSGEHRAIDTERALWRNHIAGTELAQKVMRTVTPRDVRVWLEALKGKRARQPIRGATVAVYTDRKVSRSVVRQALVLVRQAFQGAVDDELVDANPAREVKLGKRSAVDADADERWTFLTLDEIAMVTTSETLPEWARLLFCVAIYTGLRQGELWGLQWESVDLDGPNPHLIVRRSHRGKPKSGKSRVVPLLGPALEAMRRWRVMWKGLAATWSTGTEATAHHLVFPGLRGDRRRRSTDAGWSDQVVPKASQRPGGPTVKPGWKSLAGIQREVRFHDLRHTCASHLVMGSWGRTWSLSEVKDLCGHSSVKVTEKYAHLSPAHLHTAAAETVPATNPRTKAGPKQKGVSHETPSLQARPRGLEPLTSRSVVETQNEGSREVTPRLGPLWSQTGVYEAARTLFLAAATGQDVEATLIDSLVNAVLAEPMVALAREASTPGPHQLGAALRLAAVVVAQGKGLAAATGEGNV